MTNDEKSLLKYIQMMYELKRKPNDHLFTNSLRSKYYERARDLAKKAAVKAEVSTEAIHSLFNES